MDDFAYLLIIALVLLTVLIGISYYMSIPSTVKIDVANFSLGRIGYIGEHVAKTQSFEPFVVGEKQEDVLKYLPQVEVYSNLLGSKKKSYTINIPDYYLPYVKGVKIVFNVHDTNKYGNLIISWNGKNDFFYNIADKRSYTVFIEPQYVKGTNSLEISCDGPGWRFWASSVYILRDVKVILEYGPAKILPFTLTDEEYRTFTKGVLSFRNYGTGVLNIEVNGQPVFRGDPGEEKEIEFDFLKSPINLGSNIITLVAENGTFELERVKIDIYTSVETVSKTRTFELTDEHYAVLKEGYRGVIEYDVNETEKQGLLVIKLNGNSLESPGTRKGPNQVYFTWNEAVVGQNKIEFSGTGNWYIGEVRIFLEKV